MLNYSIYIIVMDKAVFAGDYNVIITDFSVVTSFKSSVTTCPFMANVTQSEP